MDFEGQLLGGGVPGGGATRERGKLLGGKKGRMDAGRQTVSVSFCIILLLRIFISFIENLNLPFAIDVLLTRKGLLCFLAVV